MATWVYRCNECGITFATEVEDGQEAPATAVCPQCGNREAAKAFELPTFTGGCSCGSGCCS